MIDLKLAIDKNSSMPLHLQLYDELKNIIVKHRFESGYAFPSERKLASLFKINRNTIHRAYVALMEDGFLYKHPGNRRLYISDRAKAKYKPSFPCIGIVLARSVSDFLSHSNYLGAGIDYLSGVLDRTNERDYSTMIVNLPPLDMSHEDILEWRDKLFSHLSGIVYFGDRKQKNDDAFEAMISYKQLPQVFVSGSSLHDNISSVCTDVSSAGKAVAELLYENGHRRVGIIIPKFDRFKRWGFINVSTSRADEIVKSFVHCGLEVREGWVIRDGDKNESIGSQLNKILSYPDAPTAFWCHNDFTALRVLDHFKQRGIMVPDDISLIGFDDINEAKYSDPPLTTIRPGAYSIGKNAVDLVIDLFENGRYGESRKLTLPASLSCRGSLAKVKHNFVEAL